MNKNILIALIASLATLGVSADSFHSEEPLTHVAEAVSESLEERIQRSRNDLVQSSKSDPLVLERFEQFVEHIQQLHLKEKALNREEVFLIFDALDFAAQKHEGQTRRNKAKTPYISHPIGVTNLLIATGGVKHSSLIIAGLLHDTVEATKTTLAEIAERFGKEAAGYVREVSHDKGLSSEERKRLQVIEAAHLSSGAAQIHFADKLYNLTDLLNHRPEEWSQERVDRYFEWAESVVNRLPASNPELKHAIDQTIDKYWESQTQSTSKKTS
jgi:guanosine-3',5'-bis(diphosphate) 3'-pyrophosphohydrolase